ncbi:MAG: hypothetical protein JJU15_11665 [Pararhodobacter sp.]|nr:hypothetical protein [Pararhodobacter sp.]
MDLCEPGRQAFLRVVPLAGGALAFSADRLDQSIGFEQVLIRLHLAGPGLRDRRQQDQGEECKKAC